MIGLDTSVLIRYIMQDDKKQSAKANSLIETQLSERDNGFVTIVTLIEIEWVLESCYNKSKQDFIDLINILLTTKQLRVQDSASVHRALTLYKNAKCEFSDAMISVLCKDVRCQVVMTFDKKAVSVGMTLLK